MYSSNFPPRPRDPRRRASRFSRCMRRSACVLPDTCRPRADPTTARMRRVALEQLRTSGAAELRASWQLDSFFDRTFVVSMRSRCLCPPVRPTASTYASQGWVACLHGRTDRRHHMQRVLAQHGTRKVGRSITPSLSITLSLRLSLRLPQVLATLGRDLRGRRRRKCLAARSGALERADDDR